MLFRKAKYSFFKKINGTLVWGMGHLCNKVKGTVALSC